VTVVRRRRHGALRFFGILLLVLLAARVALPYVVQRMANNKLKEIPGYWGSVGDVDLGLIAAKFAVSDVKIDQVDEKKRYPLFYAEKVLLNFEWRSLLKKNIVADVGIVKPEITFVAEPPGPQKEKEPEIKKKKLRDYLPFKIKTFDIVDGTARFRNPSINPQVDIFLNDLRLKVSNLTNRQALSKNLFAKMQLDGKAMDAAPIHLTANFNPLSEPLTFDLNARIQDLELVKLNDLFRAYGGFDVEKGNLSVFAELAAVKGALTGYVKPMSEEVVVLGKTDHQIAPSGGLWQTAVGVLLALFKHHPSDKQAARIPVSGTMGDAKVGIWETIGSVLKHSFIEPIKPGVEHSVNLKKAKEERGSTGAGSD
jgi:hypothetical protein